MPSDRYSTQASRPDSSRLPSPLGARLTRRAALRLGGIAVGGLALNLLAACSPATPSPTAAPTTKPAAPTGVAQPTTPPKAAAKAATKPSGLEQELALPDSVVKAAQSEGKVVFISSIDKEPANEMIKVFGKRYAGIEVEYQEASEEVRTVRTLTEFKAGKHRVDVVMGLGGFMAEYKAAKALERLADLPAYAIYEPPFRDTNNEWAGVRTQFWGIGYNAERIKPADLPKTWEDLTDPKWRGRIGMGDRPQLWAQQLWKVWGPERTTTFLKNLFANEPQRRKEGLNASAKLLAAGEYDMFIPAAPYRIQNLVDEGAKVGWISPEPIAVASSELGILRNSPHPNAAKLFTNWFLSREGQATYAKADFAVPAHPALRSDREYLGMFADAFVGRKWSIREPEDEQKVLPEVRKVWKELWTS